MGALVGRDELIGFDLGIAVCGRERGVALRLWILKSREVERARWCEIDLHITGFNDEFATLARSDETNQRRGAILGCGMLHTTTLVAAIDEG